MSDASQRTALYDQHVAAGGRMVEFAGFEMPVQYDSVIAESKAVREQAGMFDVSHMARLSFKGARTLEYLEWVTTNDVSKLGDRQGQYSLLPNDRGGAVDDIIVYRMGPEKFTMVVNAANHAKDVAWLLKQNTFDVEITDETAATSMIAVQGPRATPLLSEHSDAYDELNAAGAFGVVQCQIEGIDVFAARSGYTGEDGFELICFNADAPALWNALESRGVKPCGLGSRDVLRVEAGLPLYGHELTDELSPIAAGLGWVVGKEKKFIGSDFIQGARATGTPTKLHGVRLDSKRLMAPGMTVYVEGKPVGEISSGVFSPVLDCGIGFAFVDSAVALNTPCTVDIRGKHESGMIVSKRFYKRPA